MGHFNDQESTLIEKLVDLLYNKFEKMGACAGSGTKNPLTERIKNSKAQKFKQLELDMIELMYLNLAKRCRNNVVNRQNFDLFFHSSGLIGEILFLRFDSQKNGTISFGEFLAAFELMMKGSLRERADILFSIYDVNHTGGVKFDDLLKILFSYGIEDLNKMFVEQDFLKHLGPNQMNYYFSPEHMIVEEKNIIEEESEEEEEEKKGYVPSSVVLGRVHTDLDKSLKTIEEDKSKQRKDRIRNGLISSNNKKYKYNNVIAPLGRTQNKKRACTSTLIEHNGQNGKLKRKNWKIKSNIASLTKQYARFLFFEANLDKDKDFFSKEHFFKLIQGHTSLFSAYLSGFHIYVWQVDDKGEPEYYRSQSWIESEAEERYRGEVHSVYLKFIQQTVFVMSHQKKKTPKDIINLQGLAVDIIQKEGSDGREYGILFKHRDGLYPTKEYYFKEKSVYDEWVRHLSHFRSTTIQDLYLRMQGIGGGNFSSVFKGKDKKTGQLVAIKVIETFKLSVSERQVLKRQTGILKQCHHPNIIKFLCEFKTKTHIYIVTQILDEGDLFYYTKKNGFLEEYQAAIILKQLIDAILYLNEELGIIHRDLKPENVLIKMNDDRKMVLRVKLIDFGFGVFKDKVKELPPKQKFAGTPGFIAPEIYNAEDYDQKIDTFSLGIILYFMLSGQFPFHSQFLEEIEEFTKSCTISLVNNHWGNISDEAKDLIKKLLTFKDKRISTREMAEHPWLKNIDRLKKYIGMNPKRNVGFFE